MQETTHRFGPPDVLVNNAGVIEPIGMVGTADPAEWARTIQINLIGAYYAIRAVLPGMLERGHGDIINVSSGAAHPAAGGLERLLRRQGGLAMLTRSIDLEHRAGGIRVFGFQPGTTDTEMQVTSAPPGINMISRIPREQLTPVAQPARAIVYLCTQAADDLAGKEFACATKISAAASVSAAHDRVPRYTIVSPPDTLIVWPVMYAASSDSRNAIIPA